MYKYHDHKTIGDNQLLPNFENTYQNFQQYYPYDSMQRELSCNSRHPKQNNELQWCETCDRGFPSLDLLTKHKQEHKMCNIDGCQFVAHPKVITKHIQMQHASGVFKKIAKLNKPEEIKKWLEERKRKYPTKVIMEKKAAEIKEKIERGEKMGLKKEMYGRTHRTGVGSKRKPDFAHEKHQHKRFKKNEGVNNFLPGLTIQKKTVLPKKVPSKLPTADDYIKLKPFTGIQDIIYDDDENENNKIDESNCIFDIVDEDDLIISNQVEETNSNSEPILCSALSSLIGNYGSSEDEIVDIKEALSSNITSHLKKQKEGPLISMPEKFKPKNLDCNNDRSDDESGPEEVKSIKIVDTVMNQTKKVITKSEHLTKVNQRIGQNVNKINRNKLNKPKPKVPSTLLQKLLQREIQQERNIVLQCIRHIVKNNFFTKK